MRACLAGAVGCLLGLLVLPNPLVAQVEFTGTYAQQDQQAAVDRLTRAGYAPQGFWNVERGELFLTGAMTAPRPGPAYAVALEFLRASAIPFARETPETVLTVEGTTTDSSGRQHVTLMQTYRGVPVWGKRLVVHVDPSGSVVGINGQYVSADLDLATEPSIGPEQAVEAALRHGGESTQPEPLTAPQLVIFERRQRYHLAWHFVLRGRSEAGGEALWAYFVDARLGDVVFRFDRIRHQTAEGSGLDCALRTLPLEVLEDADAGVFLLQDITHRDAQGGDIITRDRNDISSDPDGAWDDTTTNPRNRSQQPEAAVHHWLGRAYDLLKELTGRESYDAQGSDVIAHAHAPKDFGGSDNFAAWLPDRQRLLFGNGDGVNRTYFGCANDIVAHEFMHAVTQFTKDLKYKDQSGALDEAYSDIWGAVVDSQDWLVGEDAVLSSIGAIRDMADPPRRDQPDHVDGLFTGDKDNGGVHINSGIPNKAFYLLAEGRLEAASGHVCIPGIGRREAFGIVYRALEHLSIEASFAEWAAVSRTSAADLYGGGSYEVAVLRHALAEVGLDGVSPFLTCVEPSVWLMF